jgi:multicomponent K+:H+ antiporter subunit D
VNHWLIAPILLPLAGGTLLVALAGRSETAQRIVSVTATAALLAVAIALLILASDGGYRVYALGDWPPPFGIVLVLDRLSALLLTLTALVALFSLLYATRGADSAGKNFHALFQFQLMGLNGAFLTGDLFNLFVFFEVLLIASYGLLLQDADPARTRAGLHYVVLNLIGSSLFLIALGLLYGLLGTLNMADLAVKIADAPSNDAALLRAAGLALLVVFALKAALLPLYFWLPGAYAAASTPVAALFAIMTKVGVYAIVRVFTLMFGAHAGPAADLAVPWLLPLAVATLVTAALGVLASSTLRTLVPYLIILSIGMLLTAVGLFSADGLSAALVYLMHTTLVTAGLFLLIDVVAAQRGRAGDRLQATAPVAQPLLLGVLFFIGAVAIVGLPPLSGFLGKLMILSAARSDPAVAWIWSAVLGASLLSLIALSRAGSVIFWKTREPANAQSITGDHNGDNADPEAHPARAAPASEATQQRRRPSTACVAILLGFSAMLMIAAGPITTFTDATAAQLMNPQDYIESVLGDDRVSAVRSQTVSP